MSDCLLQFVDKEDPVAEGFSSIREMSGEYYSQAEASRIGRISLFSLISSFY
jgi:hypothetical protein